MSSFEHLDAWKTSHQLALAIYGTTEPLVESSNPDAVELSLQLRRLAILPAARVARGWGGRDRRLFSHALFLAQGYLSEIEDQLKIATVIGVLTPEQSRELDSLRARAGFYVGKLIESVLMPDGLRRRPPKLKGGGS